MRWLRSAVSWVADFVIDHWVAITIAIGGFGMTYLASVSQLLSSYGAVAWAAVGIGSVLVLSGAYWLWQVGRYVAIKNRFNNVALDDGVTVNPMEIVFRDRRIFINNLALPHFPVINGKTFINCDLIGPAVLFFTPTVNAQQIRPPSIDAIWIAPNAKPNNLSNVFYFNQCTFTNCSFQRVLLLVDISRQDWKNNPQLNWISFPPTHEQLELLKPPAKVQPEEKKNGG